MRLFVQQSEPPMSHIDERRGSWVGFGAWPAPGQTPTRLHLSAGGRLTQTEVAVDADTTIASVRSPVTTGLASGQWCAYGQGKIAPELAVDQRADDIGSLVYDTEYLSETLHIIGEPTISLRASSDQPFAFVAVRLSDVHPDGTVERLSYGIFNLCHHTSDEFPSALVPGVPVDVTFKLKGIAQSVPSGHRVRVSISTSYWPMIWPSPVPATVTVHHVSSHINLPTYASLDHQPDTLFAAPQAALAGPVTVLRPGSETRYVIRDLGAATTEFRAVRDDGDYRLDDIGTELSFTRTRSSFITDSDPGSARARVECRATYRRDDWDVRIETDVEMTSDTESFVVTARMSTYERDELFIERTFVREIPRAFV